MKRMIKYYNIYQSDKAEFSDCSTKYEVLPELVDDNAGIADLILLAEKRGIELTAERFVKGENDYRAKITHAIQTTEFKEKSDNHCFQPKTEKLPVFIGFIQLENGPLKPKKSLNNPITKKMANEIVNETCYGIADYGKNINGQQTLVKDSWMYFHAMTLLGYDLKSFEEVLNIEDTGFSDDTSRCHECGLLDSNDDCYTNNFRVVQECTLLGVNCGCYGEYCESPEAIEEYTNNHGKCMERDIAEKLEESGKLKELETFIGSMVDGRGGYIRGKHTREGKPESVLAEYLKANPAKEFLFTHDESGQFQSYFSIWEIVK